METLPTEKTFETTSYKLSDSETNYLISSLNIKTGKTINWSLNKKYFDRFFKDPDYFNGDITNMVVFHSAPGGSDKWYSLHERASLKYQDYVERFAAFLWKIDIPEEIAPKELLCLWDKLGLSSLKLDFPEDFFAY
jgi:hypothetical protein